MAFPLPSISPGIPESMSGSWRKKPAVSCSLLRLQGGIASFPSRPRHIDPAALLHQQKLMWGIQLVKLTLDTLPLVCMPFLCRSSHNELSKRRKRERKLERLWVRLLIMSLKQTGRHLASITALWWDAGLLSRWQHRPHDVQAHATQPVITAYGMVWEEYEYVI